jgi:putative two-component system response regulator
LGGRIIAAVDAFDALTTERPYRDAVSPAEAMTIIRAHVGTLLDPVVVAALGAVIAEREETRTA